MEIPINTPVFLTAFTVFGLILVVAIWRLQQSHEPGPYAGELLSDPYLIAFLRGDRSSLLPHRESNLMTYRAEFLITVMISLVDRRLLHLKPRAELQILRRGRFIAVSAEAVPPDAIKKPIEQALLRKFFSPQLLSSIYGNDPELSNICRWYDSSLQQLGLLPNNVIYAARLKRCILGGVVLRSIPVMELAWAVPHGSALLALVFSFFFAYAFLRSRTPRGDAMLADLHRQFHGLRERATRLRPHQSSEEAVLVAALFGPRILPQKHFPYVKEFYPLPSERTGTGS